MRNSTGRGNSKSTISQTVGQIGARSKSKIQRHLLRFFQRAQAIVVGIVTFLNEAGEEMKRTHRPSRKELWGFTLVVLVTLAIVAFYVGILDILFRRLLGLIYPEAPTGG